MVATGALKREWRRPELMKEFIKYFTGLKRNYGYCNINKGYKDDAGKIRFDPRDYGWAKRPITDKD